MSIAIAVTESFPMSILNLGQSDKVELFNLKIWEPDIKWLPSDGMQPCLAYLSSWLAFPGTSVCAFSSNTSTWELDTPYTL